MTEAHRITTCSTNTNVHPGFRQVEINCQITQNKRKHHPSDSADSDTASEAVEKRALAVKKIAVMEHDLMEEDNTPSVLKSGPVSF